MLLPHALRAVTKSVSDPNFKQTTLLLHGDGTNGSQNNTFIDSSSNNFTVTRVGNTTQGTFTPFSVPEGYWSGYFDGTGDYLTVPTNTAFNFGTGNFTCEFWIYLEAYPAGTRQFVYSAGSFGMQFYIKTNGTLACGISNIVAQIAGTTTPVPLNAWAHLALTRSGNNWTIWINGVSSGTGVNSNQITNPGTININYDGVNTALVQCYLSNLRILKGTALYTSNFTPPTTPLTTITNTSLLTCQSNRFKDNSSNNFTITRVGDTRVQSFSPFAPTAPYSTSVTGGSMYFDGTGDYLTVPDSALWVFTGDFTIEAWIYLSTLATEQTVVSQWNGAGSNTNSAWSLTVTTAGRLKSSSMVNVTQTDVTATSTLITTGAWFHVAATRSGSTVRLFVNGVLDANVGTVSGSINNISMPVAIGAINSNNVYVLPLTGYISNLRIVTGTAVYTSNFTPPTAPLTAITNTSLLLNGTNAGIFDNTAKNNLETVGNAQIDTGTKKFGTASIKTVYATSQTTNCWRAGPSPDWLFNTGDFTVECWAYVNTDFTNSGDNWMIMCGDGSNPHNWQLLINVSSSAPILVWSWWGVYNSSANTSFSYNTWTHLAVARQGTTTRMFVNGVLGHSFTDTRNYNVFKGLIGNAQKAGTAYLDEIRITKGVARYTANFTPPSAAFPNQ